jgi:A/G-specific adenine glycosylase
VAARSLEEERNDALLGWYREHGRELPWRRDPDPYAVLVSEAMAQQTQLGRVVPRYEAFLRAFPTVEDLAAAPLRDVLAAWSGLGYNRRAERLHRAAKEVAATGWPRDIAGLEDLPGVGPYTARAIAAFAFGAPVAAVDTNLRRVLSRWHGEPLSGAALERAAASDLGADAAAWNQAVMDLGAALCRPRAPRCGDCPVEAWCTGPDVYEPPRAQGRFEGSSRQVRGAVVRALVRRDASLGELAAATGFGAEVLREALDGLVAEGLVSEGPEGYALPD